MEKLIKTLCQLIIKFVLVTKPSDFPKTEFSAKSGGANASTIETDTSLIALQLLNKLSRIVSAKNEPQAKLPF